MRQRISEVRWGGGPHDKNITAVQSRSAGEKTWLWMSGVGLYKCVIVYVVGEKGGKECWRRAVYKMDEIASCFIGGLRVVSGSLGV